jgi:hypothetical protein
MNKAFQDESEDLKAFPRHMRIPAPVPEKDTDDYEDFEDDAEMIPELWHKGELAFEDEQMSAEDY